MTKSPLQVRYSIFQIAQEVFKKIFAPNNGAFINIYEKTTQQYYYLICIKRHIFKRLMPPWVILIFTRNGFALNILLMKFDGQKH